MCMLLYIYIDWKTYLTTTHISFIVVVFKGLYKHTLHRSHHTISVFELAVVDMAFQLLS
jgi:hypothetical protein